MANEYPDQDKLADDEDELGWDREKHGRMKDAAKPDDNVRTVRYGGVDEDGQS